MSRNLIHSLTSSPAERLSRTAITLDVYHAFYILFKFTGAKVQKYFNITKFLPQFFMKYADSFIKFVRLEVMLLLSDAEC